MFRYLFCLFNVDFFSNVNRDDYTESEHSECTLLTSLKRTSSCSKGCYGRGALATGDSSLMLKSLTKGMSRYSRFYQC